MTGAHSRATALAGLRWNEAVSEAYGLTLSTFETANATFYFAQRRSMLGGVSIVTAPYGTDGGVETESGISAVDIEQLEYFRLERGAKLLLLKTRQPLERAGSVIRVDAGYVTFTMDLAAGPERIWEERLAGSMRTDVRKGMRFDSETRVGGFELFDDFLRVIRECWRDLGTPTHSAEFYRTLLRRWSEEAHIMNVYHRGTPVATAMLLAAGNTIHHPFSCSLARFKPEGVNSALTWRIVEWACDAGFGYFDMGRSIVDSGSDRYKQRWGANRIALNYGYLIDAARPLPTLHSPVVTRAVQMWKKLPLPVANALGPHFIKNAL